MYRKGSVATCMRSKNDQKEGENMKFTRTEYFASKGRKLDEIRQGDLIEYENGMGIVREVKDGTLYFGDQYDTRCEAWPTEVTLIQTAEELQVKLDSVTKSLKDSTKKD